jgi:alpha-glucosidase
VSSPDGNLNLTIHTESANEDGTLPVFTVDVLKRQIIGPSAIRINTDAIVYEGNEFKVISIERESYSNKWINLFGEKQEIPDNYNQLKIFMENNDLMFNLIAGLTTRNSLCYEFPEQNGMDSLTIKDENISFNFSTDHYAWSAARAQAQYSRVTLGKIEKGCERPLVIEIDTNLIIALAEAKLVDYARMKFNIDTTRNYNVITQLGSAVIKPLPFQSPWRVVMIGKNPGDLLEKNFSCLT